MVPPSQLDLCGPWQLQRAQGAEPPLPATVPGCVHLDLLAARQIPDPFDRDNETRLHWIGESDWIYSRTFDLPPEWLEQDRIELQCDGLDTLATVRLNGATVLTADNMFRAWTADVREHLRPGPNTLEVRFASPVAWIRAQRQRRPLLDVCADRIPGNCWIRKSPCNFGWDWGPQCVTAGIWRPMRLAGWRMARLRDLAITQRHAANKVTLDVRAEVETTRRHPGLQADVVATLAGREVARTRVPVSRGRVCAELPISRPALWWPNGLGEQPLYGVAVSLRTPAGGAGDTLRRRIGLRTLELVQRRDRWGHAFLFRCNGVEFFAKGANWIPDDVFPARMTRERYRQRLCDAAAVHMNMLRVWGGGLYEDDAFYDLCDELGLCVWQDFLFACSAYPAFDPDFRATVREEVGQNVRRLRHHACLALWCGNNELEQMRLIEDGNPAKMSVREYGDLFDRLIPQVLRRLDPGRPYIPSSEHTPARFGDRWKNSGDPACGDAHLWSVWHGRQPFEWYRTVTPRFCSEFGFQSFPEPATVSAFTAPEDRNITSRVMELHQRSGIGNATIVHYLLSWFRMPEGFENTLWLSQIQQGLAMKYAVEHWRRQRPRCMGALYWQLNDCWPAPSWSSIDSAGRWKALHYMARAFFAPLLVSGVEDPGRGVVEVHATSDLLHPAVGTLRWRVTRVDGSLLDQGDRKLQLPPQSSSKVATLALQPFLAQYTARDLLVWLSFEDQDGAVLSRNLVTFARPKHLELREPDLTADLEWLPSDTGASACRVTLTAANPALWAWLELRGIEAAFSDNFLCLEPETPTEIIVRPLRPVRETAFRRALVVRSLRDTYA